VKHTIEITELNQGRSYWECDCGIAGSCPSYNVEIVAERHIPNNEGAAYRHRSKDNRR